MFLPFFVHFPFRRAPSFMQTPIGQFFFRFFAVYFCLYLFPYPVDIILGAFQSNGSWVTQGWDFLIKATGAHVLHLDKPITVLPNGSGDTTWNYVQELLLLVFALMGTLIWYAVRGRRPLSEKALYVLTVYLRYYLASVLLLYGFSKVFLIQFNTPDTVRLSQEVGDMSPMGLAWTFVGFSKGYSIFTGGAEVLGGLLLFFRPTYVFGLLFSLTVMTNVLALNMFYDIPVKLYSSNLVGICLFLLAPYIPALTDLFVFQKPALLRVFHPVLTRRWRISAGIFKGILVVGLIGAIGYDSYSSMYSYGPLAPRGSFYGTWRIHSFVRNGQEIPPLVTDSTRFGFVQLRGNGSVRLKPYTGKVKGYDLRVDTVRHRWAMLSWDDSLATDSVFLTYQRPTKDSLRLSGVIKGDTIDWCMVLKADSSYRLMSRGFHWINEYNYNR